MIFGLHLRLVILIWYLLGSFQSQSSSVGWQSLTTLSNFGLEFSPVDEQALFLDEISANSISACARTCDSNARCRIFDFDDQSKRCRIFEGDIVTMGSIVASSFHQSCVGSIKLPPAYFADHGRSCSMCQNSRYLTCINSTCRCQPHTFFDGSICQNQKLFGVECANEAECRMDRNYTCLPRMQCGPISLQTGTIVGGYGNGTTGSGLDALRYPWGLVIGANGSLFVGDYGNNRVIKLQEGSLVGSVVAGTSVAGNSATQLNGPAELYVDTALNIYTTDSNNYRVMFFSKNTATGVLLAGIGTAGSTSSMINLAVGLAVDSRRNIYVSDWVNNRVMKWAPNATTGTVVAGTGVAGSGTNQLNRPYGLYLDEINSHLYIADLNNHRIQRYTLGVTSNGTTVAGGNGVGAGSNQLNSPYAVCLSKTGVIYIADSSNKRIQRWSPGAAYGVTIAGIAGMVGASTTLLSEPAGVALSLNESYLYVSELDNHRVLRFKLI